MGYSYWPELKGAVGEGIGVAWVGADVSTLTGEMPYAM